MHKRPGWGLVATVWLGLIFGPLLGSDTQEAARGSFPILYGHISGEILGDTLVLVSLLALVAWFIHANLALKHITGNGYFYPVWAAFLLLAFLMPVGPLNLLYLISFYMLAEHLARAQSIAGSKKQPVWAHLLALAVFPIGLILVQRHLDRMEEPASDPPPERAVSA